MYLLDANIFLEILLQQEKKEKCKKFLTDHIGELHITDFSLHSLGVILFRLHKSGIFEEFIKDVLPNIKLLTLYTDLYEELSAVHQKIGLDFDDTYQYLVAKSNKLKIVTMDKDFEKVKDVEIVFL